MSVLDPDILIAKLSLLQDVIARIEAKRPETEEVLRTDRDVQDILSKNLERAVQICIDAASHVASAHNLQPQTAVDTFLKLRDRGLLDPGLAEAMKNAVGFRNISVHEYAEISWSIVMDVAYNGVEDLKAFARWLADLVPDSNPSP